VSETASKLRSAVGVVLVWCRLAMTELSLALLVANFLLVLASVRVSSRSLVARLKVRVAVVWRGGSRSGGGGCGRRRVRVVARALVELVVAQCIVRIGSRLAGGELGSASITAGNKGLLAGISIRIRSRYTFGEIQLTVLGCNGYEEGGEGAE
jgi:hypothetical protein